ncbi:MAG TPA: DNA translocase FtsK 4TM domain-containing protein [Burkholderiaceae bacterium]|jgi:S-DNA-T family DNA segregation ATPase FtsK/SpoIIIE|nr:DNA translocase FtsK 4TM domain-containing protein [Burkholderiaceae bacterium]
MASESTKGRNPEASRGRSARAGAARSASAGGRGARLLAEAGWIAGTLIAVALAVALVSYQQDDPSFFNSVTSFQVRNLAGRVGAWAADAMLVGFGFSAYLWVLAALAWSARSWRRLFMRSGARAAAASHEGEAVARWLRALALLVLVAAFAALATLRLHSRETMLPESAGGALGKLIAPVFTHAFGFTGATVVLLALTALAASLHFGFSWLGVSEAIGSAFEGVVARVRRRREAKIDRSIGEVAVAEREASLAHERERLDEVAPVYIERPMAHAQPSERRQKERQVPLFSDMSTSKLPPLDLLDEQDADIEAISADTLEFNSRLIERKLKDFGVDAAVVAAYPGPVITRYEIEPATGVKGVQIVNLAKDLARALSLVSIRVVETIPGKNLMGLELPNPRRQVVRLSEILGSAVYGESHSPVTLGLGKDISGKPVVVDLARMPHLLVAGTTGSGKSVGVNAMILSILYKSDPSQVRLLMIDPKMLELSTYGDIPHLIAPVVTDMREAGHALNWCVGEMDRRYRLMSRLGVRSLSGYNQKIAEARQRGSPVVDPFALDPFTAAPLEQLPVVVVVIDELADLMMVTGKKVEELIARIAQKARAAGMHLILATQRPSVDVITGLIKANIPTRISFQVSSRVDSRTILDQMGAEALLGQGDMLYMPAGAGFPTRIHGAFVSDAEVHRVVEWLKSLGTPNYVEGVLDAPDELPGVGEPGGAPTGEADPLYDQAVEIVVRNRRASISLVQRHLRIGYNRAARLLEDMEKAGLVSAMQSNGNREILVPARGEA